MRLFTDGAEMGDVLFWDAVGSATAETTPAPVMGVYSYRPRGSSKGFTASAEIYFRARIYIQSAGVVEPSLAFKSGGTELLRLNWNSVLACFQVVGPLPGLTAAGSFPYNQWRLLEVHFKIDNAAGVITVRSDGIEVYTSSGDTYGSLATVDNVIMDATYSVMFVDDLALNDTTGGEDNSWCGDGYVEALLPDGNGDQSDFTGSDGNKVDNYLLVDEVPNDGDTSYVEDSVPGEFDLYTLANFDGTNKIVRRVWVESRARSTAAVGDQCKLIVKTGGSVYKSAGIGLPASYARQVGEDYRVNPNSGIAWTEADLDALQAGIEVV